MACFEKSYLESITNCVFETTKSMNVNNTFDPIKILSYKCYSCSFSYENLHYFIEHLKLHNNNRLQISAEIVGKLFINVTAASFIAKFQDLPVIKKSQKKFRQLEYKCLLCSRIFQTFNRTYMNHKKRNITCFGCKKLFYCYDYVKHVGVCKAYFLQLYPKTCICGKELRKSNEMLHIGTCKYYKYFSCSVCPYCTTTKALLKAHQIVSHRVPSDEFIFSNEILSQESVMFSKNASQSVDKKAYECGKILVDFHNCNSTVNNALRLPDMKPEPTGTPIRIDPILNNALRLPDMKPEPTGTPIRIDPILNNALWLPDMKPEPTGTPIRIDPILPVIVPGSVKSLKPELEKSCDIGGCKFKGCGLNLWTHCLTKHNVYLHWNGSTKVCTQKNKFVGSVKRRCDSCFRNLHSSNQFTNKNCCSYCKKFLCKFCWPGHSKGQSTLECTRCNQILAPSCMVKDHSTYCDGNNIMVYECDKCRFKEDTLPAINDHCQRCYTMKERLQRMYVYTKVLVPAQSISTDPNYDHSYSGRPPMQDATDTMEASEHTSHSPSYSDEDDECDDEDPCIFYNILNLNKPTNSPTEVPINTISLLQTDATSDQTLYKSKKGRKTIDANVRSQDIANFSEAEDYFIESEIPMSDTVVIKSEESGLSSFEIFDDNMTAEVAMDSETPVVNDEKPDNNNFDKNVYNEIPRIKLGMVKREQKNAEINEIDFETVYVKSEN